MKLIATFMTLACILHIGNAEILNVMLTNHNEFGTKFTITIIDKKGEQKAFIEEVLPYEEETQGKRFFEPEILWLRIHNTRIRIEYDFDEGDRYIDVEFVARPIPKDHKENVTAISSAILSQKISWVNSLSSIANEYAHSRKVTYRINLANQVKRANESQTNFKERISNTEHKYKNCSKGYGDFPNRFSVVYNKNGEYSEHYGNFVNSITRY